MYLYHGYADHLNLQLIDQLYILRKHIIRPRRRSMSIWIVINLWL